MGNPVTSENFGDLVDSSPLIFSISQLLPQGECTFLKGDHWVFPKNAWSISSCLCRDTHGCFSSLDWWTGQVDRGPESVVHDLLSVPTCVCGSCYIIDSFPGTCFFYHSSAVLGRMLAGLLCPHVTPQPWSGRSKATASQPAREMLCRRHVKRPSVEAHLVKIQAPSSSKKFLGNLVTHGLVHPLRTTYPAVKLHHPDSHWSLGTRSLWVFILLFLLLFCFYYQCFCEELYHSWQTVGFHSNLSLPGGARIHSPFQMLFKI